MLGTRLMSISVLMPIIIAILFFLPAMQFVIFSFFICLIGSWEWGKIVWLSHVMHRLWMCIIFLVLFGSMGIIILQYYLQSIFWYVFLTICFCTIIWWIIAYLLILFYPSSIKVWRQSNLLCFCFGILIFLPFFLCVSVLHQFYYINNDNYIGKWWLLYIITLVWINDSIAYIIGRGIGRRKLSHKISPKKTWEGCIGGILVSSGVSWLCIDNASVSFVVMQPVVIFFCSLIAIVASVIGDLSVSMFKRVSGCKDSGKLIPGHGGVLDRMDSLVSAVPIFTCLIFISMFWFN